MTDCDLAGHVLGWPEFDALALREIDVDALLAFYDRYGFASMRKRARDARVGRSGAARAERSRPRRRRDRSTRPTRCRREAIVKNYETVTTLERARRLARADRGAPS